MKKKDKNIELIKDENGNLAVHEEDIDSKGFNLLSMKISNLSSKDVTIHLSHVGKEDKEVTDKIKKIAFDLFKDEIVPNCEGLDVLLIQENKENIFKIHVDSDGVAQMSFNLPTNVIKRNEKNIHRKAEEMVFAIKEYIEKAVI